MALENTRRFFRSTSRKPRWTGHLDAPDDAGSGDGHLILFPENVLDAIHPVSSFGPVGPTDHSGKILGKIVSDPGVSIQSHGDDVARSGGFIGTSRRDSAARSIGTRRRFSIPGDDDHGTRTS
jgi:hypothetical protein